MLLSGVELKKLKMSLRENIATAAISCLLLVACGDNDSALKPSSDSEYKRTPCDVELDNNCIKDDRDGQTYRTVKIGDQVWMAENLNYRYLGPTADLDSSSFCYNDDPANCTKYGRLYLWSAAMDSAGIIKGNTANDCGNGRMCAPSGTVRGVCPQGWRLPSYDEWEALIVAVNGVCNEVPECMYIHSKHLISTNGWNIDYPGDDESSFSALPAGYRTINGYHYEGAETFFWSSTDENRSSVCLLNIYDDLVSPRCDNSKDDGFSVRCLKD